MRLSPRSGQGDQDIDENDAFHRGRAQGQQNFRGAKISDNPEELSLIFAAHFASKDSPVHRKTNSGLKPRPEGIGIYTPCSPASYRCACRHGGGTGCRRGGWQSARIRRGEVTR
jgi:hypothetical protein